MAEAHGILRTWIILLRFLQVGPRGVGVQNGMLGGACSTLVGVAVLATLTGSREVLAACEPLSRSS
jgi:hypothetical protein